MGLTWGELQQQVRDSGNDVLRYRYVVETHFPAWQEDGSLDYEAWLLTGYDVRSDGTWRPQWTTDHKAALVFRHSQAESPSTSIFYEMDAPMGLAYVNLDWTCDVGELLQRLNRPHGGAPLPAVDETSSDYQTRKGRALAVRERWESFQPGDFGPG